MYNIVFGSFLFQMIRNHRLDPESSSSRGAPQALYEGGDDWYTAGPDSPTNGGQIGMGGGPHSHTYSPGSNGMGMGAGSSSGYGSCMPTQGQGQGQGQYGNVDGGSMGMGMGSYGMMGQGQGQMGGTTGGMYDDEPPLLEELGINFDHILSKTRAVMYPRRTVPEGILDDTDLAGPLLFCLLLGALLLISGKIHFGYIFGFSVFGCFMMNVLINLIHPIGLDFWRTCSAFGYCLLPILALATVAIVMNMRSFMGFVLSCMCVGWCTFSSTKLLNAKMNLTEQYWLVAYPTSLLYSCFVLITIF
jgi:protein YIPF5/7